MTYPVVIANASTANPRTVARMSEPQQAATLLCLFKHNTSQKTPFGRRVVPWCDRVGVLSYCATSDVSKIRQR